MSDCIVKVKPFKMQSKLVKPKINKCSCHFFVAQAHLTKVYTFLKGVNF